MYLNYNCSLGAISHQSLLIIIIIMNYELWPMALREMGREQRSFHSFLRRSPPPTIPYLWNRNLQIQIQILDLLGLSMALYGSILYTSIPSFKSSIYVMQWHHELPICQRSSFIIIILVVVQPLSAALACHRRGRAGGASCIIDHQAHKKVKANNFFRLLLVCWCSCNVGACDL